MILIGLLFGFTLALFGGAIARLDALDTGLGRKSSAWIGLEYAWAHVGSYLQALLLPLGIVAVLTGLVALVGAPFNLPYLDIIGSLIYVVAIVVGLVSTILLVGFGVLTPLLIGAVAVERADAGDAIQRGWSALFKTCSSASASPSRWRPSVRSRPSISWSWRPCGLRRSAGED